MKETEHIKKEPLFHIVKRDGISPLKKALLYAASILIALFVGGVICSLFSIKNPIDFFTYLYEGAFGTERKIWLLLQDTALLLGVSLALVPAFKMKFWNLGGNGQILVGCLAYVACMFYLGGKVSDMAIVVLGLIAGVLAGAIWALIPAIFKAFFNTNESLFTLMMNYIASGLILMFITIWVKSGSGVLLPINAGNIPEVKNRYLLTILVFAFLAILMHVYLKYSKQGYEISVVGESRNTAKYIGINVKKVIIRTLVLSGAIAGLVGAFIGGAINHTVSTASANNMGFTAIMTAWLANFNPLGMIVSCFFITFISKGMVEVGKKFKFTNDAISNIVIGIVYFFVIAVTFFISYRIVFREGSLLGKLLEKVESLFLKIKELFAKITKKVCEKIKPLFEKMKKHFKKGETKNHEKEGDV